MPPPLTKSWTLSCLNTLLVNSTKWPNPTQSQDTIFSAYVRVPVVVLVRAVHLDLNTEQKEQGEEHVEQGEESLEQGEETVTAGHVGQRRTERVAFDGNASRFHLILCDHLVGINMVKSKN